MGREGPCGPCGRSSHLVVAKMMVKWRSSAENNAGRNLSENTPDAREFSQRRQFVFM